MIAMTLREMAELVGGTLDEVDDPEVIVSGEVVIDSREAEPAACSSPYVVSGSTVTISVQPR